jgi:hypothetical protein
MQVAMKFFRDSMSVSSKSKIIIFSIGLVIKN